MSQVKVIQIGFNKCGTRSMFQFFRRNKLKSMHWNDGVVGGAMRRNLVTGRRPFEGHEEFVFYSDVMGPRRSPIFEGQFFYKQCYEAYPGSLFILNTRNEDNWIKSRMRHPDLVRRFMVYYGIEDNDALETHWREMWRVHHADVRSFFADKPDVFLEFDIENHGGEELAAFVKPHYNMNVRHWGHMGKAPEEDTKAA
ncbi:MAG: sulfotransferase [Pseudomonadota bacterium]